MKRLNIKNEESPRDYRKVTSFKQIPVQLKRYQCLFYKGLQDINGGAISGCKMQKGIGERLAGHHACSTVYMCMD